MTKQQPPIFSVDAETNGLFGGRIAIAVVVRRDGKTIDTFQGKCPLPEGEELLPWVRDNVFPAIAGMEENYPDRRSLEEGFWAFWEKWRDRGAVAVAHCGTPVEAALFAACQSRNTSRIFEGPLPLHEVGTLLFARGHNPASVDDYVAATGGSLPEIADLRQHHPLYDALQAATAWERLQE